ncbi:MAG: succinate dehydrogenase cytochrome b subunit [Verrucomicrobiota bacterium]
MNLILRIWRSSLGKKYIMAITGAGMIAFVAGHLIGNLQIFLGADAINKYAYFLQHNKPLLYVARLSMIAMVTLHFLSAFQLWRDNVDARPMDYANGKTPFGADLASRTMVLGGVIIATFVIYHLLHYTVRLEGASLGAGSFVTDPMFKEITKEGVERHDVFAMMVAGFQRPLVALFYMVGVGLLCLHLSHGIAAMFQSLGLKNHVYGPLIDKLAKVVAVALFLGYVSIPGSILVCKYGDSYLQAKKNPNPIKAVLVPGKETR